MKLSHLLRTAGLCTLLISLDVGTRIPGNQNEKEPIKRPEREPDFYIFAQAELLKQVKKVEEEINQNIVKTSKEAALQGQIVDEYTAYSTFISLLQNYTPPTTTAALQVTLGDLEILSGIHAPRNCLLNQIDKTITMPGRLHLAYLLGHTTPSIEVLRHRQEIIKSLNILHDNHFNGLTKSLEMIHGNMNAFLQFFVPEPEYTQKAINSYFWSNRNPISRLMSAYNTSPWMLQGGQIFNRLFNAVKILGIPVGATIYHHSKANKEVDEKLIDLLALDENISPHIKKLVAIKNGEKIGPAVTKLNKNIVEKLTSNEEFGNITNNKLSDPSFIELASATKKLREGQETMPEEYKDKEKEEILEWKEAHPFSAKHSLENAEIITKKLKELNASNELLNEMEKLQAEYKSAEASDNNDINKELLKWLQQQPLYEKDASHHGWWNSIKSVFSPFQKNSRERIAKVIEEPKFLADIEGDQNSLFWAQYEYKKKLLEKAKNKYQTINPFKLIENTKKLIKSVEKDEKEYKAKTDLADAIAKSKQNSTADFIKTKLNKIDFLKEQKNYFKDTPYASQASWLLYQAYVNYYGGGIGAALGLSALPTWGYFSEKKNNEITNYLHAKMIGIGQIVRALQTIAQIIKVDPTLSQNLEHLAAINDLFDPYSKRYSSKMHQLIDLLLTNTFTGEPSYFSLKGRVLAAYILMTQCKHEFIYALQAAGEIDAFLSCSKLYGENYNSNTPYTFVEYLKSKTPIFKMKDMWNPLVNTGKTSKQPVVTNSIALGPDARKNILISGPNAGGKSTFMKGIGIAAILGQSLGIAPTKDLKLTPFSQILTYMNIADDTAGGVSRYKSEVKRAESVCKAVDRLAKNKFSLCIMDELYSGAAPKEAAIAGYSTAEKLGEYPNNILVLASHFNELKKLEANTSTFANYKVEVIEHGDGSYSYTYKIVPGASTQNIALEILKEANVGSEYIDRAQAVIAGS